MGDNGAGVADTMGYDAGIGDAIDAGVGTGARAGVSTGTNFGCADDAGMDTNDGSGGTALAGVADGAPAPDFGATSVTRRSSGTFDSAFFWLEQPPATTHNNPIAMNVRVVTNVSFVETTTRRVRPGNPARRASQRSIGNRPARR